MILFLFLCWMSMVCCEGTKTSQEPLNRSFLVSSILSKHFCLVSREVSDEIFDDELQNTQLTVSGLMSIVGKRFASVGGDSQRTMATIQLSDLLTYIDTTVKANNTLESFLSCPARSNLLLLRAILMDLGLLTCSKDGEDSCDKELLEIRQQALKQAERDLQLNQVHSVSVGRVAILQILQRVKQVALLQLATHYEQGIGIPFANRARAQGYRLQALTVLLKNSNNRVSDQLRVKQEEYTRSIRQGSLFSGKGQSLFVNNAAISHNQLHFFIADERGRITKELDEMRSWLRGLRIKRNEYISLNSGQVETSDVLIHALNTQLVEVPFDKLETDFIQVSSESKTEKTLLDHLVQRLINDESDEDKSESPYSTEETDSESVAESVRQMRLLTGYAALYGRSGILNNSHFARLTFQTLIPYAPYDALVGLSETVSLLPKAKPSSTIMDELRLALSKLRLSRMALAYRWRSRNRRMRKMRAPQELSTSLPVSAAHALHLTGRHLLDVILIFSQLCKQLESQEISDHSQCYDSQIKRRRVALRYLNTAAMAGYIPAFYDLASELRHPMFTGEDQSISFDWISLLLLLDMTEDDPQPRKPSKTEFIHLLLLLGSEAGDARATAELALMSSERALIHQESHRCLADDLAYQSIMGLETDQTIFGRIHQHLSGFLPIDPHVISTKTGTIIESRSEVSIRTLKHALVLLDSKTNVAAQKFWFDQLSGGFSFFSKKSLPPWNLYRTAYWLDRVQAEVLSCIPLVGDWYSVVITMKNDKLNPSHLSFQSSAKFAFDSQRTFNELTIADRLLDNPSKPKANIQFSERNQQNHYTFATISEQCQRENLPNPSTCNPVPFLTFRNTGQQLFLVAKNEVGYSSKPNTSIALLMTTLETLNIATITGSYYALDDLLSLIPSGSETQQHSCTGYPWWFSKLAFPFLSTEQSPRRFDILMEPLLQFFRRRCSGRNLLMMNKDELSVLWTRLALRRLGSRVSIGDSPPGGVSDWFGTALSTHDLTRNIEDVWLRRIGEINIHFNLAHLFWQQEGSDKRVVYHLLSCGVTPAPLVRSLECLRMWAKLLELPPFKSTRLSISNEPSQRSLSLHSIFEAALSIAEKHGSPTAAGLRVFPLFDLLSVDLSEVGEEDINRLREDSNAGFIPVVTTDQIARGPFADQRKVPNRKMDQLLKRIQHFAKWEEYCKFLLSNDSDIPVQLWGQKFSNNYAFDETEHREVHVAQQCIRAATLRHSLRTHATLSALEMQHRLRAVEFVADSKSQTLVDNLGGLSQMFLSGLRRLWDVREVWSLWKADGEFKYLIKQYSTFVKEPNHHLQTCLENVRMCWPWLATDIRQNINIRVVHRRNDTEHCTRLPPSPLYYFAALMNPLRLIECWHILGQS